VRTSNAVGNTVQFADGKLWKCAEGKLYVTTTDPRHIYNAIGVDRVLSVEEIGVGYHMMDGNNENAEKPAFLRKIMD